MQVNLTEKEKEALELSHQLEKDGRIRDRLKSVLLRNENWSLSQIAQALRIHNDTVSRHIRDYLESQKTAGAHKGSENKLTEQQRVALISHISRQLYMKACDIVAYVKTTYGVTYSVSGMKNWLRRAGFTYKKPKGQPAKRDKE